MIRTVIVLLMLSLSLLADSTNVDTTVKDTTYEIIKQRIVKENIFIQRRSIVQMNLVDGDQLKRYFKEFSQDTIVTDSCLNDFADSLKVRGLKVKK